MTGPADPRLVRQPTPHEVAALLNAGGAPVAPPEPAVPDVLPPPTPLPPLRERLTAGRRVGMLHVALAGEAFLFALDLVLEAVDAPTLHDVPHASGALRGMLALRGALLPAFDAGRGLRVGAASGAVALVVGHRGGRVALLVDDAVDVVPCEPALIRSVPGGGDGVVLGAYPVGGRLASVVDLPSLLAALDLSPT